MAGIIEQTPSELLDWTIDWTTRGLGSDTINSSSWAVSSPEVVISSPSIGSPAVTTTIWITGGTPGLIYQISNTVLTVGGRTLQEVIPYVCLAHRVL